MMQYVFLTILLSVPAVSATKTPAVHVMVLNPDWPEERLKDNNVEVLHPDDSTDSILTTERDAMLQEAKIDKITSNWSQLDKNMIFLRASYLSTTEMQAKYPDFSQSQIVAIMEVAKIHDAGHRL